jgi:hypothetical protein
MATASNSSFRPYQYGAYHMIGNDNWEPQRTNNFEIHIYGLDSLTSADKGLSMPSNAGKFLTLSTDSVGDLGVNIDALNVDYGNNRIHFAGKPDYSTISLSFNDFVGLETERIIAAWHKLVYNPKTQQIGRASVYKKPAHLLEFSPDGDYIKCWELHGCFPTSVSYTGYNQSSADIRKISVTLSIDYAIPLDD